MQDKRKVQDLADLGWGKMEAMLDSEMPQKKDKNRLLIWFFLGLGLAIVTSLIYWSTTQDKGSELASSAIQKEVIISDQESYNQKSTHQKSSNQKSTHQKSSNHELMTNGISTPESIVSSENKGKTIPPNSAEAGRGDATLSTQNFTDKEELNGTTIQENKEVEKQWQESIPARHGESKQIQKSEIVNLPTHVPQQEKVESILESIAKKSTIATSIVSTNSKSTEVTNVLPSPEEEEIEFAQWLEIPFIKSLEFSLLELPWNSLEKTNMPDIVFEQTIPSKKSKTTKWMPSMYAGAHFNPFFDLGGYEFGLFAEKPLSKKLALSLGIGLADLNKKGFEKRTLFERAMSADDLLNPSSNGGVVFELNGLDKSEIASSINKLVYLQIPLNLHYQFHKNVDFFGGVNVGYLINVSATGSFSSFTASGNALQNVDLATSALFSSKIVNRWDKQLVGGANVKLFKQLDLIVSYRYGLNSIVNSEALENNASASGNTVNDFNRTVFLGLKYNFRKK